jgi:predicted RNase H-like HicB family nuclease
MARGEFYALVEKDGDGGFTGEAAQFSSCRCSGRTLDELMDNMRKALKSHLQKDDPDRLSEVIGMYKIEVRACTNMKGREFYVLVKDDEEGGYIGIAPELKGCLSHGLTLDELMQNMDEVVSLCLEDGEEALNPCFFGVQRVAV